jgi:hypothetical protein
MGVGVSFPSSIQGGKAAAQKLRCRGDEDAAIRFQGQWVTLDLHMRGTPV